jgi:hypothetical protein
MSWPFFAQARPSVPPTFPAPMMAMLVADVYHRH